MDLSEEEEGDVRSLDEPSEAEPLASEVSCAAADPSTLPGSLVERLLAGLEGVGRKMEALSTQFDALQDKVNNNQLDLQNQIQLLTIARTPTPEVYPDQFSLADYRKDTNPDCASCTVIARPAIAESPLASAHLVSGRTSGAPSVTPWYGSVMSERTSATKWRRGWDLFDKQDVTNSQSKDRARENLGANKQQIKIQSNQEDMEIQWSKIDSIASGQMHVDRELTQYGKMRSGETEMNRHSDPSDFVDAFVPSVTL